MKDINYKYLPLSFIKSQEEQKRQLINTVLFYYVQKKFNNLVHLSYLIESTQYGYNAPALDNGKNKFLRISDIKEGVVNWESVPYCDCTDEETYLLNQDDILVARTGGTTGKSFLIQDCPENAVYAGYLIRLRAKHDINAKFIYAFLNSYAYWPQISEMKMGSAQPNVNAQKLKKIIIPNCPKEEQDKIVSFIETGKTESKTLRKLIDEIAVSFDSTNKLDFLFHQQNKLLTSLRQSILADAISGKLVEQDPSDEPASELLKRIKVEKEKLIKEKKIKKQKPLQEITTEEIPFDLPKEWEWVRLGEICEKVHYGFTASANNQIKNIRLLRITDIQNDLVNWNSVPGCEIKENEIEKYLLNEKDILIARTGGTIGKSYLVQNISVNSVFASYLIRLVLNKNLSANFVKLFLGSKFYWEQLIAKSMGTGQPNVNGQSLSQLIFPLPPLNEQKRIVQKVDQLMKLTDQLEAKLKDSQENAEKLMQAVLSGVFKG